MTKTKTQVTDVNPRNFIETIAHPTRQADAIVLLDMFTRATGFKARMWGPAIIGFGRYHYRYASGRDGESLATGFSPRAGNLSIYIMPGYQDYRAILERLGKHKLGKSCLYINKLADVDMLVLEELVRTGLADLDQIWPVHPE